MLLLTRNMSWSVIWTTAAIFFVVGVTCLPVDVPVPATELLPPFEDDYLPQTPATELLPPKFNGDDGLPTLATDLVPPPLPSDATESTSLELKRKNPLALFLINVYAVKNHTAEDDNDVLHNEIIDEVPKDVDEPLAVFLLVVEDKDEDHPVDLDEVAEDLKAEGFDIEKVQYHGQTRIVKVNLESAETLVDAAEIDSSLSNAIQRAAENSEKKSEEKAEEEKRDESKIEQAGKLMKVRRKRHVCLKCMVEEMKAKKFHKGGGGGCNGGCGGGGGYYPAQPVQVQPVYVVPVYGGGGGHKPDTTSKEVARLSLRPVLKPRPPATANRLKIV
uniref:Uncharacterized protein n=1 Tax=Trichogramma kaykai TaxID=54128 RepID=A0ABD2VT46_9HYME